MGLGIAERAAAGHAERAKSWAVIIPRTGGTRGIALLIFDTERCIAIAAGIIVWVAGLAAISDTLRRLRVVAIAIG